MNQERLQKVLARAGIASRRHAEELIVAGRVRVNGRVVTELGMRVDAHHDKVEVDGRRIVLESPVYAILHKPRGVVTTLSDPEGRPTIAEHVKSLGARVFPVGRLDFHTSGALLVTNDGALAQALLHPRQHVPKVYLAKVRGVPTDAQLDAWRNGVVLPPTESDPDERPEKTQPAEVHVLRQAPPGEDSVTGAGATWIQVTLREGRTRQIHRMADATGLFVMRLVRLSFAGITTEGLRPGELRELTDKEVTALRVKYLRPIEQGAPAEPTPDEFEAPPTKRSPRREGAPRPARHEGAERPPRREPAERTGRFGAERSAGPRGERSTKAPTARAGAGRPTRYGAERPAEPRGERPPRREGTERPARYGAERPRSRDERPSGRDAGERRPRREGAQGPAGERRSRREGAQGERSSGGRTERAGERGPRREGAERRPRSAGTDGAPRRHPGGERKAEGAAREARGPRREAREGGDRPARAGDERHPRKGPDDRPSSAKGPRAGERDAGRGRAPSERDRRGDKPRGKPRGRS